MVEADYCSFFPDELFGVSLRACCYLHDLAYSFGTPKLEADLALAQCVAQAGLPAIGGIMFMGVTLFGWLFYRRRK